jgi:hypothetical protein
VRYFLTFFGIHAIAGAAWFFVWWLMAFRPNPVDTWLLVMLGLGALHLAGYFPDTDKEGE